MRNKIAIFGGSFNPFGLHHLAIVLLLLRQFKLVVIVLCGPRPDKQTTNDVLPVHRAAIVDITLRLLIASRRVRIEYFDLENQTFTRTHKLQERFAHEGELWHVVGGDLVKNGNQGKSFIQSKWQHGRKVWNTLNFAVITRPGHDITEKDLPPRHTRMSCKQSGSSSEIRDRAKRHEPLIGLVDPAVASYIERHGLYSNNQPPQNKTFLNLDHLRLKLFWDPRRKEAVEAAKKLRPYVDNKNPNLGIILGGDGTLLHGARELWPLRIPLFPINYGTVGYNLDNIKDFFRPEMLLQRPLEVYHCPLLYTEMTKPSGQVKSAFAFNDAWVVTNTPKGKTAWMKVWVNGQVAIRRAMGDGFLLATAQGNTAYAKAMGTHRFFIDTPKLVLAGNNIYSPDVWTERRFRLLDQKSEVLIQTLDTEPKPFRPLYGLVDGVPYGLVHSMRAHLSRYAAVELAFLPGHGPEKKYHNWQFPKSQ